MKKFIFNIIFLIFSVTGLSQVTANFDVFGETQGCAPFVVEFMDLSTGSELEYFWDFGNGLTSNEQNPTNVFTQPGFYTISLAIANQTSTDTITKFSMIRVNPAPLADFSVDDDAGCSPHFAQFTDLSIPQAGTIKEWFWAFGNGESSTEANPSVVYTVIKDYDVYLKIIDANNCEATVSKSSFIKLDGPTADFSVTDSVACGLPSPITFVNQSIGNDIEYYWDFGDGTNSTGDIPGTHYYNSFDSITAFLAVTEKKTGCSDTLRKDLVVGNYEAEFDWNIVCGKDSFTIEVENKTSFFNTLRWKFGSEDYDPNQTNKETTSHLFPSKGPHEITLKAEVNPSCWDTTTISYQLPLANFNHEAPICQDPFEVSFTNLSKGTKLTYNWDFGDTIFSEEPNPIHFYEIPPEQFIVRLEAQDTFGCTNSRAKTISVPFPIARFYEIDSIYSGCAPLTVTLKDTSYTQNAKISYRIWDFGDPSSGPLNKSTDSIPSHTFEKPGEYDVTYIIFTDKSADSACSDTNTFKSIIRVGEKPDSATFEQFTNDTICYGGSIQFIDTAFYRTEFISSNYFCYAFEEDQNKLLPDSNSSPPYECTYAFNPNNSHYNGENPSRKYEEFNNTPELINNLYYSGEILPKAGQLYTHLFIGYNDCLEEVIKPTFVDTTIAINGYALPDSFLLFADSTLEVGFYQASMNYDSIAYSYVYKNSPSDTLFYIPQNDTIFKVLEEGFTYGIKTKIFNTVSGCENESIDIFPIDSVRLSMEYPSRWCLSDGPTRLIDLSYSKFYKHQPRLRTWKINGENINSSRSNDTLYYQFPDTGTFDVSLDLTYDAKYTLYGKRKRDSYVKSISGKIKIEGVKASGFSDTTRLCKGNELKVFSSSSSTTLIDYYEWHFGDNTDSILLKDANHLYELSGIFTPQLFVSDTFGCVDSVFLPEISVSSPIIEFNFNDDLICAGDLVAFTNKSKGETLEYTWTFIDSMEQSLPDTQFLPDISQRFDLPGTYDVKLYAEDKYSCKDSLIKTDIIEVSAYPRAAFEGAKLEIDCPPLSTSFTDTSSTSAVSWKWNFGDGKFSNDSLPSHIYTSPGLYDVRLIVFNYAGCSDTLLKEDYIRVNGPSGEVTYENDSICLPDETTFTLNLMNTKYITINYNDGNILSYDVDTYSDSVNYTYNTGGAFQPIFELMDELGCTYTLPLTPVINADSIAANFTTTSPIICDVNNIPFTNTSRYTFTPQFNWTFGDNNNSNDESPTHSFSTDSLYSIQLTLESPIGCMDSVTKELRVYNNPQPELSTLTDNFCIPAQIVFKLNYGNPNFNPDSTFFQINNLAKSKGDSIFYNFTDTGKQASRYMIHFGEGNCLIDDTIEFNMYKRPIASFSSSSDQVSIEEPLVEFQDKTQHTSEWKWNFGDGDTSTKANPIHAYSTTGLYDVRLIVSNDGGCFDTIIQQIGVAPDNFVKLPSGFSPNGDGKNETFRILTAGSFELVSFKIFNRWGNLVFETNDIEKGWDGMRNGKPQNSGTYIYYLEYKDQSGKLLQPKHGNFTLLR